jgi:hypothetical protein
MFLTLARYKVLSEEGGINPKSEEQGFPRREQSGLNLANLLLIIWGPVIAPTTPPITFYASFPQWYQTVQPCTAIVGCKICF